MTNSNNHAYDWASEAQGALPVRRGAMVILRWASRKGTPRVIAPW